MKRIVVVDDEPLILNIIQTYLNKDFDIVTFDTPSEALKFMKTDSVDLVISDFYMPEMTGLNFSQKIKEINPSCPTVLISGSHVQEEQKNEFVAFIKKPCRPNDLLKLVKQKLQECA